MGKNAWGFSPEKFHNEHVMQYHRHLMKQHPLFKNK